MPEQRLTEYQESRAFICVACGVWLPPTRLCANCGLPPRFEWLPFFELTSKIQLDIIRELYAAQSQRMFNAQRVQRPTHAGAGVEVIAIVSSIALGVISNASYDFIKRWLLSKKKRIEAAHTLSHQYKYEKLVEIVIEHFETHPELRQELIASVTATGLVADPSFEAVMAREVAYKDETTPPTADETDKPTGSNA
jgi:hypothetical protein